MKRQYEETRNYTSHFRKQQMSGGEYTFQVHPTSRFSDKFPFFREPKEIGCFSQDECRKFRHDKSQLQYFVPPVNMDRVLFDLTNGYNSFIKRDDTVKENLDSLLKWIALNEKKFTIGTDSTDDQTASNVQNKSLNTDFVCWRGLLTKLVCTPYENRDGWKIVVIKHRGTYFLCEFDTEQRMQQKASMTDREKEMAYWGLKFEQYVTAEKEGVKPDTTVPVNNHSDFASVVRSRLKKHSLVYGGEVDCYEEHKGIHTYVELKTSRQISHERQWRNFVKFKLIKWWAQSFLIGIPKIVCGFRDDDGMVHELKSYNVHDLPKLAQEQSGCWDAAICFNFCDSFLQFVKDTVASDNSQSPYVFEWEPRQPIRWRKVTGDTEYAFLPHWFLSGELPPDSQHKRTSETEQATQMTLEKNCES